MIRKDRPKSKKPYRPMVTATHQTLITPYLTDVLGYSRPDKRFQPRPTIVKNRISYTLTGQTFTEEHRQRISEALRGQKKSEKTRKRMSRAKRHMTKETRLKMSQAKLGERHPMWGRKGELNPRFGKKFPKTKPEE